MFSFNQVNEIARDNTDSPKAADPTLAATADRAADDRVRPSRSRQALHAACGLPSATKRNATFVANRSMASSAA